MNLKIPENLQIIKSSLNKLQTPMLNLELNSDWLKDPSTWNKEQFTKDVVSFIEHTQGANAYPNMVLIGMLAHQIDLYVQCSLNLNQEGLVEKYNNGVTSGASLYFSIADKTLNRVLQIMKELGLTPAHRIGKVLSTSPESLAFQAFMAGP